ncbi:MAG: NAD(P)-dependent oxidoreductase [Betaproteobacteria bacterium]|nr:NAD(P)-dependent oxidoreductase [Betaproteobacteria bacterium]
MEKHVGFIGLGNMGAPMASRLIDAGFKLTVYDVRKSCVDALVARGASAAASPAAVASVVDTVLLSLPDPVIVRQVALGADGVIAGTRVKTVLDLSTTGARAAQEIAAALAAKGITGVDSPVSGGVTGAVKGTLAVMVACPRALFAELEPMLKHIGRVFFIGEHPGMGQTMKLANNLLSATSMAATSEAIAFGVKAGLDPATMVDVINAGSGRTTASESKFPNAILTRTFDFGFTTGLMYKDVKLCLEEALAANVPMPVATAVRDQWRRTAEAIGPEKDFTTIAQLVERDAGVEIRKR